MKDISHWRRQIDEIDEKILDVINKRAECVLEIGKLKSKRNIEVFDPERESDIISHLREINNGPLSDDAIQRFFECLINESKLMEKNNIST